MNKSFIKCFLAVSAFLGTVINHPGNSFALQGIAPSGPIGGTDINQALLPPPGLYIGLVGGYMDFTGWIDNDGNKIDAGDHATISAVGMAYVWDFQVFGGSILSSISSGYQDQKWSIGGSEEDHFYGMIDIYSDIFYWGRFFPSEAFTSQPEGGRVPFGLAIGGGLGMTFPTGTYDDGVANNIGSNVYTISPSISFTYTTPSLLGKTLGDGTQFSTRIFYNEYTDQDDKNYRNGDIINIDYAVTQIKENWQYGITGAYYFQVQDDEFLDGTTGVENRTRMFSVGPVVAYNFMIGERAFFAKFKNCYYVDGQNVAKSTIAFLSIGTKF